MIKYEVNTRLLCIWVKSDWGISPFLICWHFLWEMGLGSDKCFSCIYIEILLSCIFLFTSVAVTNYSTSFLNVKLTLLPLSQSHLLMEYNSFTHHWI
jgi:hypothetical protein